jgi:hypothetical protein
MLNYPCRNCLVVITCSEECDDLRSFLENTADIYYLFTQDELISYRELPNSVRSRIFDMAFVDGRASKQLYRKRREELYGECATA